MKVARQYVVEQTQQTYSSGRWIKTLADIWFAQFDMGSGKDLSAFEHIIVGEQDQGKASGYHFWYKYYLDDSLGFLNSDDIDYVGPRFDGSTKLIPRWDLHGFVRKRCGFHLGFSLAMALSPKLG